MTDVGAKRWQMWADMENTTQFMFLQMLAERINLDTVNFTFVQFHLDPITDLVLFHDAQMPTSYSKRLNLS